MGFGGIIAGALEGGAKAVGDIADKQIDVNNKEHLAKFAADLDLDKMRQAETLRQSGVLAELTGPIADAKLAQAKKTTLQGSDAEILASNAKVAAAKAASDREAYNAATEGTIARRVLELQAESNAELARIKAEGGDPAFVEAKRKLAQAAHIETQGSLAQAALARLQMTDVTLSQKLHADLQKARETGDEAKITVAQQAITDKAFTGKDTGAAYKAYQSASIALIGAQEKLADPTKMYDAATKAQIQSDIDGAKAVLRQSMNDMGIKAPDKAAPAASAVNPSAFDKGAKKPSKPAAGAVASDMGVGALITQEDFAADVKTMDPLTLYSKYKNQSANLLPNQRAIVESQRASVNSRD